jgi:SnoaL-like domain
MNSSAATVIQIKPQPLRAKDVSVFLASYKEAWETRNAELAASLFTRDARYYPDPFAEPIASRESIHDYWRSATSRQDDIHFSVKSFFRNGYIVVVEWNCNYRDVSSGERRELAGMFIADFYGKQVRNFREYWRSRGL